MQHVTLLTAQLVSQLQANWAKSGEAPLAPKMWQSDRGKPRHGKAHTSMHTLTASSCNYPAI